MNTLLFTLHQTVKQRNSFVSHLIAAGIVIVEGARRVQCVGAVRAGFKNAMLLFFHG